MWFIFALYALMGEELDINLQSLRLIRLVAECGAITAASAQAGLSPSSISRHIQAAEARLGFRVFDRTTRKIQLTEKGFTLLRETQVIPHVLDEALRRIRELDESRLKVCISTGLTTSHIAGIFHAYQKMDTGQKLVLSQMSGENVLRGTIAGLYDLGILTGMNTIPSEVEVCHRIEDVFVAITNESDDLPYEGVAGFRKWAANRDWLLPNETSTTRRVIDDWALTLRVRLNARTELENFDLMGQLVGMGMGVALVPRRAVGLMSQRKKLKIVSLPKVLKRELVVIRRKSNQVQDGQKEFLNKILFST